MKPPLVHAIVRELDRALGMFQSHQGRIARGNARKAVFHQLSLIRRMVDDLFPSIPKAVKPRKSNAVSARHSRLIRAGFVPLPAVPNRLPDLSLAGIRTRRGPGGDLWVPAWVLQVGVGDIVTLRRFKHDLKARKVHQVISVLEHMNPSE